MTDSLPPESLIPDAAPTEDIAAEAARMLRKIGWEPSHLQQIRVYARMEPWRKIEIMLRFRNAQVQVLRERIRKEHPDYTPLELALALRRRLEMSKDR